LTSTLVGVEWSASSPCRFILSENTAGYTLYNLYEMLGQSNDEGWDRRGDEECVRTSSRKCNKRGRLEYARVQRWMIINWS
jgi:hypothetical protein